LRSGPREWIVRGNVVTMDPLLPRAKALAVRHSTIVAVGSLSEARAAVGHDAELFDAGEATITPGLIDTHNHMLWTGIQSRLVELGACRTIADVLNAIKAYAAAHADVEWVVSGEGWHVANLAENRYPSRDELDAVCPNRAVYLPRLGHAAVANSVALIRAGIDESTTDPMGGRIVRADDGRLTGLLLEPPAFELVAKHVPRPSPSDRRAALLESQRRYHAAGITGIVDPGLRREDLQIYFDAHRSGELTMRSVVMPLADSAISEQAMYAALDDLHARTGEGGPTLRFGGVKVFLDGGASFGTALMREPYPDERCNCGIQVTPTTRFERLAHYCAANGWSIGVHVVGGGAIDIALDVFAAVDRLHPIRDLRFTLIHAYLWPSEKNVQDAARLGVCVATQPMMQYQFGSMLVERFGLERMSSATPIRSWLDGGVDVGGGSDSPIAAFEPLLGLWQATTRVIGDESGTVVGERQAIEPAEALALYTRTAAKLCFAEKERGMLRPGLLADWVALSVDPTTCAPSDLKTASVLATAVDGQIVHAA
jgi:predicted amidohydrolase YtcJ